MQFTYGGVEFTVSFGMLFQKAFWEFLNKNNSELDGVDLLAVCMYEGNKAHVKLNGAAKAFANIQAVYQLIETKNDAENELLIIGAFTETQFYKSIVPQDANAEKKHRF